jgi:DNA-directed RNA polymerase subunit RPC12/RpoP
MAEPDLLICPECGSDNFEVVQDMKMSGKDFGAGKACCGYILLGPLGLLCGACGKGKELDTKTAFVCKNCGNKFRRRSNFEKMVMPYTWKEKQKRLQAEARARRAAAANNNGNASGQNQ